MSEMSDPFSFNAGAVESEYTGNIGQTFLELGEADEDILLVSPDLGAGPITGCLLYTSPSPRDRTRSRLPSSA